MELRFKIEDETIERLKQQTGLDSAADVTRDAVQLLSWATERARAGHTIASIDPSGNAHSFATFGVYQAGRRTNGE